MSERLLKINGQKVDIDEQTAIGVDLQSYNIKNPAQKHINVSNNFTIPPTVNNLAFFGNINDPQSVSVKAYDSAFCEYWVDNELFISNAKIRLQSISDRIEVFIYEKKDFWTESKKDLWKDTVEELFDWLVSEKGLPDINNINLDPTADFFQSYIDATEGVKLPIFMGSLTEYQSVGAKHIEQTWVNKTGADVVVSILIQVDSDYFNTNVIFIVPSNNTQEQWAADSAEALNANGVFSEYYTCYAIDNELRFISNTGLTDTTFNVDIAGNRIESVPDSTLVQRGVNATTFTLDSINDIGELTLTLRSETAEEKANGGHFCIFAKTLFEFIEYKYNVSFLTEGGGLVGNIWDDVIANALYIPFRELNVTLFEIGNYFDIEPMDYFPSEYIEPYADKTMYDIVNSFMQVMNIVKDEVIYNNSPVIRLARFDDIKTMAEVKEFSGKMTGQTVFKPYVEGYSQLNRIKFKSIYPDGDEFVNSKTLNCLNKNLDAEGTLLEIDAYVPSVIENGIYDYLNLKDSDSFKTFTWMLDSGVSGESTLRYLNYDNSYSGKFTMPIAALYDLNSEYNFLDEIINYPKFYEIYKWLTISDIRNLEYFKQYYIRELNGSFFINKIIGFNPLSKQPTKLEVIRISDKTPLTPPDLDYWADGILDPFVDGLGDYFY